jgi:predicted methyltransferase
MECRRPTAVTVDGKCVSCFLRIQEILSPMYQIHPDHREIHWTKKGLEMMAKYGINPKDVRIVELEEA